jgi:hypothetical protein
VEAFRSQEERCRRLAKSIYNIEVAADLEAYAQHLVSGGLRTSQLLRDA